MRAIVVMFDTLNRRFLPPYGAKGVHAPNFERLAQHSVQFDNCYGGSMPCMPARREMHTARYNFLHRSWGPLEPFDDSVPQLLTESGVYTHLVTDHQHYWLDGGATYHPRFRTFELFRGQEGDEWKGHVADPDLSDIAPFTGNHELRRQDRINRGYLTTEAEHPQTRTFDAGLHFIDTNADQDSWMVQIETFDPHEPFFSYEQYHQLYEQVATDSGLEFDWPDYVPVTQSEADLAHLQRRYLALLSMCDHSLGRVLDAMDRHQMWDDTMLIVCTDHGLLLGEHDWLGKNVMPLYDETIHTPLFVWDPRTGVAGESRDALVQTIDLGPTLLEAFGLEPTPDMQGRSLAEVIRAGTPVRDAALFGLHGGHVCVTDGRYVYMRACAGDDNQPLFDYTLMPTSMRGRFTPEVLARAELVAPFGFTKGVPVLKVPAIGPNNPAAFGSLLFDLATDPVQADPLTDPTLEQQMAELLVALMRANEAPAEQFERLGLPATGPVLVEHLALAAGSAPKSTGPDPQLLAALEQTPLGTRTVRELRADREALEQLRSVLGDLVDAPLPAQAEQMTLVQIAGSTTGLLGEAQLRALAEIFNSGP
ncbi:sulfatase [Ruania albidiflava]|uniref:sulfatase n=1 Tax=Ruania albidiflava TaxID=366586 RepID=UPI0003B51875|nr:sulfatase [Ruania albidiflava]